MPLDVVSLLEKKLCLIKLVKHTVNENKRRKNENLFLRTSTYFAGGGWERVFNCDGYQASVGSLNQKPRHSRVALMVRFFHAKSTYRLSPQPNHGGTNKNANGAFSLSKVFRSLQTALCCDRSTWLFRHEIFEKQLSHCAEHLFSRSHRP